MFKVSTVLAVLALTAGPVLGALDSTSSSFASVATGATASSLYINYFGEAPDSCSQITETAWVTVQQVQYITAMPVLTVTQWKTVQQTSYVTADCTSELPSSSDLTVSYSSIETSVQDTATTPSISISWLVYTPTPPTSAVVDTSSAPQAAVYVPPAPSTAYVSTPATTTPAVVPTVSVPSSTSEHAYVSTSVEQDSGHTSYQYSGDGTYFSPGLGACGWNNVDGDHIAALNAPQFGNYVNGADCPYCGKCAEVKGPLGTVKVKIVDKCPVCKFGDLDLSPSAFNLIADPVQGRVPISWNFVDC